MRERTVAVALVLLVGATSLDAQGHRALLELGPGSLSPDDPFKATLSFRGSAGWILNSRNAIAFDYTRQSANRNEGADLGRHARQYIGLAWQHAFRDAYGDEQSLKQQYLLRLVGGVLTRGRFRGVQPSVALKKAGFFDVGVSIRYPFTNHLAAVGTIEDALAFLPKQVVTSGSTVYDFGGKVQNNFGLFILVQWRP